MAEYRNAILKVLLTEGGYANDPNDAGGETYKGIARKFWPNWKGWKIIDSYNGKPNFLVNLKRDAELNLLIFAFYKDNFWDKIGGDFIDDQDIAYTLVDSAVNEGIKPAIKRAQAIVAIAQTGVITSELVTKLSSLI
jgi:lysozyme family protein